MGMESASPNETFKALLSIEINLLHVNCACEEHNLASLLGFCSVPKVEDLPQRGRGTSRQEMMLYERNPPLIREDVLERATLEGSATFRLLGSPK